MSETIITNVSSATTTNCGVVKVGDGLSVTDDGTLNITDLGLPIVKATLDKNNLTVSNITGYDKDYDKFILFINDRYAIMMIRRTTMDVAFGMISLETIFGDNEQGWGDFWFQANSQTEIVCGFSTTMNPDMRTLQLFGSSLSIRPEGVTENEIADLAVTTNKIRDGAVTTAKIADGAITKAKLASDVGVGGDDLVTITCNQYNADKTWSEIDTLYKAGKKLQVLDVSDGSKILLPLTSVTEVEGNQYEFAGPALDGGQRGYTIQQSSHPEEGEPEAYPFNRHYEYPTATATVAGIVKVGNGLIITDDGTLTARPGGSGSASNVTATVGSIHSMDNATALSVILFDVGKFTMYLITFTSSASSANIKAYTSSLSSSALVVSPGSTNTIHNIMTFGADECSFTLTWFKPKSTSAQAALASLVPVQDECEQMEAEVAKLEQDWIDNPDETVAVDGNGVPITIATKKTELEKKQAELEKLREDYFSKLGDWKNEVQE